MFAAINSSNSFSQKNVLSCKSVPSVKFSDDGVEIPKGWETEANQDDYKVWIKSGDPSKYVSAKKEDGKYKAFTGRSGHGGGDGPVIYSGDSMEEAIEHALNFMKTPNNNYSFGPKKRAKVVAEIMAESGDVDRSTHLGGADTDIVYDDETFTGTDGVYVKFVPEAEVVGVSLDGYVAEKPKRVQSFESLDDYFEKNKDKIESSRGDALSGSSTVIEVAGDKYIDAKPNKKTRPEDVAKFSNAPPLSKGVYDVYMSGEVEKNPFSDTMETMLYYPSALDGNIITVFDEDSKKFEKGEIFNSKGTTDWKKFSLKPKSLLKDGLTG